MEKIILIDKKTGNRYEVNLEEKVIFVMIAPVITKKVILTAGLKGLAEKNKIQRYKDLWKAHDDNAVLVPALNPSTGVVDTKITTLESNITLQKSLFRQYTNVTEVIHQEIIELDNIFIDDWMPYDQKIIGTVGGDIAKVKLLKWRYKGGEPELSPIPQESAPLFRRIVAGPNGLHTLFVVNNITNEVKKPRGICRIDIYGQTGGTAPQNLAQLIANGGGYLGEVVRGKFINIVPTGNQGKFEHYIAVYVDSKTKKPFSQSVVASSMIN